MATVTARIERVPYQTHLTTGTQVVVADEPADVGGGDKGMKPGELLAGSLAACTLMTLRMYADRKNWPLDSAVVHVTYSHDPTTKRSLFSMQLILNGSLDQEQRARLLDIANRCPIHQALKNPIDFDMVLVDDARLGVTSSIELIS